MSYPITVSHKDGSFYVTPAESIEAGLLDGMMHAQAWATRIGLGSIAWTEITDRFVKGEFVASKERVTVFWTNIPAAAEDTLTEWIFENAS